MNTEITINLMTLATEINALDGCFKENAMQFAYDCGTKLLAAKELVGHGNFEAWVESNCTVGHRQAQKYMRITKNWEEISKANSNTLLDIDEALVLLSKPKSETKAESTHATHKFLVSQKDQKLNQKGAITSDGYQKSVIQGESTETTQAVVQEIDEQDTLSEVIQVKQTLADFSDEELLAELQSRGYRLYPSLEKKLEPLNGYDGSGKLTDAIADLHQLSRKSVVAVSKLMGEARLALDTGDGKKLPPEVKLAIYSYLYHKLNS